MSRPDPDLQSHDLTPAGASRPGQVRCRKFTAALSFQRPLLFGGSCSRFPVPVSSSPSATWIRATGQPILQGGAQFGYTLLSVVMISNLMAILLQHLSIKLGVATGRDLAQACRDHYSTPTVWFLWILCEIAIAACDLAEVVGSAIALQLLFGIPLVWGCVITAADVLAVLYLQSKGFRYIEALVITLIPTIARLFCGGTFLVETRFHGHDAGVCSRPGNSNQSRHALCQHRHHRRDRHAAQSLPALVHRPDAQI